MKRSRPLPAAIFTSVVLLAGSAWALGLELNETKEELGLKYNVAVSDHGTGRVTIQLTLEDQGRMKPMDRGIEFVIPSQDGSGMMDLSMAMDRQLVDGKEVMSVHLQKDLAKRAQIRLKTSTFDGLKSPRTWYYYVVPLAADLKADEKKK